MNITPVIPDGYNGPIKQLTCRICKHIFYLTMADYDRLTEVHYCHECSLILIEELGRNQMGSGSIPPTQTPLVASLPFRQASTPVHRSPEPASASPRSALRVPQPRSIDRDKMTVQQLLEEAKMLDKTWRYKEALLSYEQALQGDAACLEAFYGKGEMLSRLDRTREALAVYDDILRLDPDSARAWGEKGWTLVSLRRYTEAEAAFDHALQLDPSANRVQSGKHFLSSHIFRLQGVEKDAATVRRQAEAKETLARPCRSAEDYYEAGYALITLDRDAEAFAAFTRSIELDPFNLDVYDYVSTLHFVRGDHEKSLALYDQALQSFVDCAALHEKRAEVLVRLKRYPEALDACNRALQLDNTRASACSEKGEILHQLRRFREALEALDLAINLDPDAIAPRKRKAEMLADWGKHEDALAVYDQVIQLDPYDFYSYWEKARLLARIGRDEDALAVYDQYIDQNPQSFHGYEWKLLFITECKRYADGLATCERCIAQHLYLAQAYEWRGRMLQYVDRDEEALASYEEAHRLDPGDEGILLAQVGILARAKRFDEALERC
jgi:tetratricopeptide (TPR) repeat protein